MEHRTRAQLDAGVGEVRESPSDDGRIELIVRRPEVGNREVVPEATLDLDVGVVGDNWLSRGNRHRPDGSANPEAQITLMNSRAAALIAGSRDRWPLAGDQLYVDLDLGGENLPAGSRLALGEAIVEVTDFPHTGCKKFAERFGQDAVRFVNSEPGRELNLRGINARVVSAGSVRCGDVVRKVTEL